MVLWLEYSHKNQAPWARNLIWLIWNLIIPEADE